MSIQVKKDYQKELLEISILARVDLITSIESLRIDCYTCFSGSLLGDSVRYNFRFNPVAVVSFRRLQPALLGFLSNTLVV